MPTNLATSPVSSTSLEPRGGSRRAARPAARLALALAAVAAASATACTQNTHLVGDVGGAGRGATASGGMSGQAGAGAAGRGAMTGTGGTGTGGAAGGRSGTGGAAAGGRAGGTGSGGTTSGGASGSAGVGGWAGPGGTTASGGTTAAGGAMGTGGAAGASCPPALPPGSSSCDPSQKGLVCAYRGPQCVDARSCNCDMDAGMTGPCAWFPGLTAVSCPVDGGADASDGGLPQTSIDYTGCDLGSDLERIAVFRVDRTAATCIYMLFARTGSLCSNTKGLQSGDWCLNASLSQDVASCDQHKAPSNAVNASSMAGSFTFAAGNLTYGMDVTLQFPLAGVPEAGQIRVLAQTCHTTCMADRCDTGSHSP